jgi:hypothetical protein
LITGTALAVSGVVAFAFRARAPGDYAPYSGRKRFTIVQNSSPVFSAS